MPQDNSSLPNAQPRNLPRRIIVHEHPPQLEQIVAEAVKRTAHIHTKQNNFTLILGTILLLSVIINCYFLFSRSISQTLPQPAQASDIEEFTLKLPDELESQNTKQVLEFAGNKAVSDIGAKVDLGKETISNQNHPNCQTPIVPPLQNGCGFAIVPTALGVPVRGVIFQSLEIDADLPSSGKIVLDLKNYEKDSLQSITILNSADLSKKILLPENISSASALYFRFWNTSGITKIRTITLHYFNVETLYPASFVVDSGSSWFGKNADIYQDIDEDNKYSQIDKKWSCKPNFPGVDSVSLNSKTQILRQDKCFVDIKPDIWYTDKKTNALPAGKWLLVSSDKKQVEAFEVKPDENNQKKLS